MPNLRYELHHKICNLRYGTHGYGMSAYLVVAKFKVFNSLQFKKLCLFDRYDTR